MVIQRIRELNKKVPFQPYQVRLTSGVVYPVPHPDFILVSPKGGWIDIADEDDNGHHISALLIEEVTVPAQKNGSSGNGN